MSSEKEQLARQKVIQKKQEQAEPGSQKDVGGGVLSAGDMQALQGMVGNTAVGQLGQVQRAPQNGNGQQVEQASHAAFQNIVQRKPSNGSSRNVIQRLPDKIPKADGNIDLYQPVSDALDHFNLFIDEFVGETQQERQQQMEHILRLYDAVSNSAAKYLAEKPSPRFGRSRKRDIVENLFHRATRERVAFLQAAMPIVRRPDGGGGRRRGAMALKRWSNIINGIKMDGHLPAPERVEINENSYQRTVGGGMNQLRMYNQDNMMGFFKDNQDHAPNEQELDLASIAAYERMDRRQKREKKKAEEQNRAVRPMEPNDPLVVAHQASLAAYQAAQNMGNLAITGLGIDPDRMQLQNRDLAMSRLDSLLGSNVIARTELALRRQGDIAIEGSLMAAAEGRTGGNQANYEPGNPNRPNEDTIDVRRGDIQRHLSKLQLLDILARQIDRNQGNFFLATDGNGNVIDIKGIDNDMSFGRRDTSITANFGQSQYPGITAYVDEEMALRIMQVNAEDIQFILGGLLPQEEIASTIGRLIELQGHLKRLKDGNKLLKPNDWNMVTSNGLLENEPQSYYARLARGALQET